MDNLDKLKGAVQMVCNMLARDKKPARDEAAVELKEQLARLEADFRKLQNTVKTTERKRKNLYDTLNRLEWYSDGVTLRSTIYETQIQKVLKQNDQSS